MKRLLICTMALFVWSDCLATIDIAIKIPEGVVFASDSRVTGNSTEITSDTYEKIVKVTRYVMAQTAGNATPGNKNLRATIQDFRWKFSFTDTSSICIDSVAKMFVQYCENR